MTVESLASINISLNLLGKYMSLVSSDEEETNITLFSFPLSLQISIFVIACFCRSFPLTCILTTEGRSALFILCDITDGVLIYV